MNQCKKCGAILPDNARFCLQCGAEVVHTADRFGKNEQEKELDFLKPSLVGGLLLGLLGGIPYIRGICCIWVLAGGGLAAFLLNKQRPGRITYGDGAFAGAISGLFGAIVSTVVQVLFLLAFPPDPAEAEAARAAMNEAFDRTPNFPPAVKAFFDQLASGEVTATTVLLIFIVSAISYALFAMIGGIIGAAILNRKKTD